MQVDFLALSFVRDADVIKNVRSYVNSQLERRHPGHEIEIVAKIEAYDSVLALPAIIDAADGIMVARSDLGAQIPLEDVPAVQKEIVFRCRQVRPRHACTASTGELRLLNLSLGTMATAAACPAIAPTVRMLKLCWLLVDRTVPGELHPNVPKAPLYACVADGQAGDRGIAAAQLDD